MTKNYSNDEFCEIIEERYNRCFVCKEKLVSSKQIITISKKMVDVERYHVVPWEFLLNPVDIRSDGPIPPGNTMSGADAINVHKECFFDQAGKEWEF